MFRARRPVLPRAHVYMPASMRASRSVLSCARATACSQCRSRATCALQPAAANDTHAALWHFAGSSSSLSRSDASRQLPPLPEKSVFRRVLPDQLVAFSSAHGRRYFAEAMASGHLEPYFPLSEQFHTQEEPTFCGLGTLTMVMNALRIDPRRRWRDESGPGWRWWSDAMFPTGCSNTLEQMRSTGTTMDDFCLLAAANGADVRMRRATDDGESLETFRHSILNSALGSGSLVVTSFCRASLDQTGTRRLACDGCLPPSADPRPIRSPAAPSPSRADHRRTPSLRALPPRAGGGHFSPIGGYHASTDSALVLDVARFKYPPYWVALSDLWRASLKVDEETGKSRGWFELKAAEEGFPREDEAAPSLPGARS